MQGIGEFAIIDGNGNSPGTRTARSPAPFGSVSDGQGAYLFNRFFTLEFFR